MDGIDTLRGLKKINPDCVVVMLTSLANRQTIDEAVKNGAVELHPQGRALRGDRPRPRRDDRHVLRARRARPGRAAAALTMSPPDPTAARRRRRGGQGGRAHRGQVLAPRDAPRSWRPSGARRRSRWRSSTRARSPSCSSRRSQPVLSQRVEKFFGRIKETPNFVGHAELRSMGEHYGDVPGARPGDGRRQDGRQGRRLQGLGGHDERRLRGPLRLGHHRRGD